MSAKPVHAQRVVSLTAGWPQGEEAELAHYRAYLAKRKAEQDQPTAPPAATPVVAYAGKTRFPAWAIVIALAAGAFIGAAMAIWAFTPESKAAAQQRGKRGELAKALAGEEEAHDLSLDKERRAGLAMLHSKLAAKHRRIGIAAVPAATDRGVPVIRIFIQYDDPVQTIVECEQRPTGGPLEVVNWH